MLFNVCRRQFITWRIQSNVNIGSVHTVQERKFEDKILAAIISNDACVNVGQLEQVTRSRVGEQEYLHPFVFDDTQTKSPKEHNE